jgi:hypothetical protein
MSRRTAGTAHALLVVVFTSCAKPLIIYVDPSLSRRELVEGGIGFLMPTRINLAPVVQEYSTAFAGDVAAGEAATLGAMREGLCQRFPSSEPAIRVVDLAQVVDTTGVSTAMRLEVDQYGVSSMKVTDPGELEALLNKAGIGSLVLIADLAASRGSSSSTAVGQTVSGTPLVVVPSANSKTAILSGHVFLWSASTRTVRWNGFINGRHPISINFTRGTATGMGTAFVVDLEATLFWLLPGGGARVHRKSFGERL